MNIKELVSLDHIILASVALISVIALFTAAAAIKKANRLNRLYRKFTGGREGKDIEELLIETLEKVRGAVYQVEELQDAYRKLSDQLDGAIQKVGIVRFNPFNDTGSDLSFAVALLDKRGNGIVITSLFGRDENRTYGKPIMNGASSYQLSGEEENAITLALKN